MQQAADKSHLATASSPLPAVLTCLNINKKGEGGNVSIKHQECLSRKMDCFQDTMQALASLTSDLACQTL